MTGEPLASGIVPGELLLADDRVEVNAGRPVTRLLVRNTGDRPVQVGSHFHLADVNDALEFDRAAARGLRLDVASGTAVRFEPGVEAEVAAVPLGGARIVPGLRVPAAGELGPA